jgi:hypothetical protein
MGLETVFDSLPNPQTHTFPEYSLPTGEAVRPIAITSEELATLLTLYESFAAVDPTGMDQNPFLAATSRFVEQTFGATFSRPDERLDDDIAALLNDFSDDLGGRSIGVADATLDHHRTLYYFLVTCKGYHMAPHLRFRPDESAVETLYEVYERVAEQAFYLKRPSTVLEG